MLRDSCTIEVNNLGKRFNREWIFRNLTYTFRSGNTYIITGPNGSGKSTLMQVLWGQIPQSTGTITFRQNEQTLAQEDVFKQVSLAAPYQDLIEEFTLTEHLRFHFTMRKPVGGLTLDDIIDKLYLAPHRDKPIANFSSGMKQRVKLGLAFFTEAPVLFLDEPGTNLDEQAFDWYHERLREQAARRLIFVASNQKNEYPPNAEIISLVSYK